jgi:hypothetical protein
MLDVKELCERLSKFHWSPRHPSTYLTDQGKGLGNLAEHCYGSFNLIWATHPLETRQDHLNAISAFTTQRIHSTQIVKRVPLSDWLTLLNPQEFSHWYASNRNYVNSHSRTNIEKALYAIQNVQRL